MLFLLKQEYMNFFIKIGEKVNLIRQGRLGGISAGVDPNDAVNVKQMEAHVLSVNKEQTNTSLSGTTITLTDTPNFIFGVYKNGQRLTVTVDYTVSGSTITFIETLVSDSITVIYN